MKKTIKKDTVIIGAGITGLTAAYYLKKKEIDLLVLEEQERAGGVIRTVKENGFIYETGPNTGVLGQPEAALLFEDLGGKVPLEIASEEVKKRYVLKDGRWEPLPSGLKEAVRTPLFTTKDKFRILGEPFRRRGRDPEESLEGLVLRRMGRSYLDYAVDPFILGVYAGDPHELIPKYALPKLYNLEQDYGSFIGGSVRKKLRGKTELEKKATREVFSVKGGLQNLVDALYREVGEDTFRFGAGEVTVERKGDRFQVSYLNKEGSKEQVETGRVVVTTGAHHLPSIFPGIGADRMEKLSRMRYARVIEVTLGFKYWHGRKLDGFGGLIPYREQRDLLGVLFLSSFLSGRAPEKGALLTLFLGGVRRPDLFEKSDDELIEIVKREVTDLMELEEFDPDLFRITRHRWAIPQYERSSGERFRTIAELENEWRGLLLRGNFQGGIGLADRIRQGRKAAEEILESR